MATIAKECRICHGAAVWFDRFCDTPCACTGSLQYVHHSCLYQWREMAEENEIRCSTCDKKYKLDHEDSYTMYCIKFGITYVMRTILMIAVYFCTDTLFGFLLGHFIATSISYAVYCEIYHVFDLDNDDYTVKLGIDLDLQYDEKNKELTRHVDFYIRMRTTKTLFLFSSAFLIE
jgi:E3 ubiquitin-protein ligase DOA10